MYLNTTIMLIDFRFVSATQTSSQRFEPKHQAIYLNLSGMSHRHLKLMAKVKFQTEFHKPFPCLFSPSQQPPFQYKEPDLLEDSDIIHGTSPYILVSNPAANPANSACKISFGSCFYPSLLLPSHLGLLSSLSSKPVMAPY